jgi:ribosomal protein S18 acetylase RimI-like enzyme
VSVRALGPEELPNFENLAREDFRFVFERSGTPVGRVGYSWAAPRELALYGLRLPWESEYLEVGRTLIRESLRHVRDAGADLVEARLNPAFHSFAAKRAEVLAAGGFALVQEKLRVMGATGGPAPPVRLDFRTRADVGRDAFVDAVAQVTAGTLDRVDALEVERLGPRVHAEVYVKGLEDEGLDEEHWLLADDGARLAALLVLTEWDDETGVIAYVGVVPELRGRGHARDLVAIARARLADAGYAKVLADVDVQNGPMRKALEAGGLSAEARLSVHWARLDRVSD